MLDSETVGRARAREATGGIFLDSEPFTKLKLSRDPETFASAWLDILARIIDDLHQAVVVLGPPGRGPFTPAALWPKGSRASRLLAGATDSAVAGGRLILQSNQKEAAAAGSAQFAVAYPLVVNGQICGAAAIEIGSTPDASASLAIDQMEWSCSWLEILVRRQRAISTDRIATVIELLATSLHHERFQAAATAVATELAGTFGCERVSIGFLRGQHIRVRALSHSAFFGKKAKLTRAIEAAMDEAVDQQAVIVFPTPEGAAERVVRAHAAMQRDHNTGPICSVPLSEGRRLLGALTLERSIGDDFDDETVQLTEHVATLLGPVLEAKRRDDRWLVQKAVDSGRGVLSRLLGPRHVAFKLSALAVVGIVTFFIFATAPYRVTADATLEGTVQRAIAAPIAGYLAEANVRAGDIVRQDEVMALLDERDLRLERLKWVSQRAKQQREYQEALAKHERAEARILQTQIEQADAQIELLDEQLARIRITAPFDGFVVTGDLSQALGAPVERGDVLFEVAPLHAYRVILEVDEREVGNVAVGQTGHLALNGMPDAQLPIEVDKITPVSTAEEGQNHFKVEARLLGDAVDTLRPGMEGVAKIYVDERKLIWIWTHKIIHWLRMFVWTWWP